MSAQSNVGRDNADGSKTCGDGGGGHQSDEPLLRENPNRFVIFPIDFPDIWRLYKKQIETFWTVEMVGIGAGDIAHWKEMPADEKRLVSFHLAYLASRDAFARESLNERLLRQVQVTEARCFLGFQAHVENIHMELYSNILEVHIASHLERDQLIENVRALPCFKKRATWSAEYALAENLSIGESLVAYKVSECLFNSSSFAVMLWLKSRHLFPAMTQGFENILRDKALYCEFAQLLYHQHVQHKPHHDRIAKVIIEAANIEKEFFVQSLTANIYGLECSKVEAYIESLSDHLLMAFGCPKYYNSANPFAFLVKQQHHPNPSRSAGDGAAKVPEASHKDFRLVLDADF